MVYFDGEFCDVKTLADLRSFIPQDRIKLLREGNNRFIQNSFFLINANYMLSTCFQEYFCREFRVTCGHKYEV